MLAWITSIVVLLLTVVIPTDESPVAGAVLEATVAADGGADGETEVEAAVPQYMLVLRRFQVPTEAAEALVAGGVGGVSRAAVPKLRPFQSLPEGTELDIAVEHVAVSAADQPRYAVLRKELLGNWITDVQAENQRSGGVGVCLLAPKLLTSEGRTAEFAMQGDPAVQLQSRISGRADGTMQADVLLVRDSGGEGGDRRHLQLEFSVVLSEEQPHFAVVLSGPQAASAAGAFRRIITASVGKAAVRQSEVWTVTCERIEPGAELSSASRTFDRPAVRR